MSRILQPSTVAVKAQPMLFARTMIQSPLSRPYAIQRPRPDVSTTSILSDRSLVEPRGNAFRTCGRYDSEVRTAERPPTHGKMLDNDETPLLGSETPDPLR